MLPVTCPATLLDLGGLREVEVVSDPFEHFLLPGFVRPEHLEEIRTDFPRIAQGGSFPLAALQYGPAFRRLTDELLGEEVREILADKFHLDLTDRPATLTVRGRTRLKDGQIHTDSRTKLITVLIYLNPPWAAAGGRLRLLRSADNLDDCLAEVPPEEGALVAFRCRPNAWHGHYPFDGQRRSLQLNYVTSDAAGRWSSLRHSMSAWMKTMLG